MSQGGALPAALDDERSWRPARGYSTQRLPEPSRTMRAHISVRQDGSGPAPAMYARLLAALHSGRIAPADSTAATASSSMDDTRIRRLRSVFELDKRENH